MRFRRSWIQFQAKSYSIFLVFILIFGFRLDKLDFVGLHKNGLDGHAAVDVGWQVQLDSWCKAVGIFDSKAIVFDEKFNIVVLNGFDDFFTTGDFYSRVLRGKRIQSAVIETDKVDGNVLEFFGLDF